MIAKDRNQSLRKLFISGGRLDILLWDHRVKETANERQMLQFGKGLELLEECPCGCGLKDDICKEHQAKMTVLNDEIPF